MRDDALTNAPVTPGFFPKIVQIQVERWHFALAELTDEVWTVEACYLCCLLL